MDSITFRGVYWNPSPRGMPETIRYELIGWLTTKTELIRYTMSSHSINFCFNFMVNAQETEDSIREHEILGKLETYCSKLSARLIGSYSFKTRSSTKSINVNYGVDRIIPDEIAAHFLNIDKRKVPSKDYREIRHIIATTLKQTHGLLLKQFPQYFDESAI